MKIIKIILLITIFLNAELSPNSYKKLQESAEYILLILPIDINKRVNLKENRVYFTIKAKVKKCFKAKGKITDTIIIKYNKLYRQNRYILGPAQIQDLKEGLLYIAYLKKIGNFFKPSAYSKSFKIYK